VSGNESGSKWWIRYVAVPIVAGGGVIALLVGVLRGNENWGDQSPKPIEIKLVPQVTPAQQAQSTPTQIARLHVAVEPDAVEIVTGEYSVISYRFRELVGIGATIESQDRRWVLPDGTELYVEKGGRIIGGSFVVDARGTHELLDKVYLPSDIGYKALRLGQNQVRLETSFSAIDFNDQTVRAKALLHIEIKTPMPGGPEVFE
jgi:hypothetical protein